MMDTEEKVLEYIHESDHEDVSRREIADAINVPYDSVMRATVDLKSEGKIEVSREIGRVQMFTATGVGGGD